MELPEKEKGKGDLPSDSEEARQRELTSHMTRGSRYTVSLPCLHGIERKELWAM